MGTNWMPGVMQVLALALPLEIDKKLRCGQEGQEGHELIQALSPEKGNE
jgi:hypothetical protein